MADTKKRKSPTSAQLELARQKAEELYGRRTYITGIDRGYRWTNGAPTKDLCVRIHVREKKSESQLEAGEVFPTEIEGVEVDVYEGVYSIHRASRPFEHQARKAVLSAGISVSHPSVSAGTLGYFAADKSTGQVGMVSNWHVLVGPEGRAGDAGLQPGTVDGGRQSRDAVATVSRWVLERAGDAAFAPLNGRRAWAGTPLGLMAFPSRIRKSRLGETLVKSGRTTAVTQGRVDGEGMYRIPYEVAPGIERTISVSGFKIVPERPGNPDNVELSLPGDSGSPWLSKDGTEAVGLHFAGERSPAAQEEFALACYVENVFERLNLRLASAADVEAAISAPTVPGAGKSFDLDDILHAYEAGRRAGAEGGGAGIERAGAAMRRIDTQDIWRKFRAAFADFINDQRRFNRTTPISSILPDILDKGNLAAHLNGHPEFAGAGLDLRPEDIIALSTMGEIVSLIISAYQDAGWTVTTDGSSS